MSVADTGIGLNGDANSGGKQNHRPQKMSAPENLSIDEIMLRVRAEVSRRRSGQISDVTHNIAPAEVLPFGSSVSSWEPAVPRLPVKDKYELRELLAFSDADFISVACRAIMRHPPDEAGFNHYLQLLRSGAATKIEILRAFLSLPDGQSSGVYIEGLDRPLALEKWRRKKTIGPIVSWLHSFLRLGTLADRQMSLDTAQARETHELGRTLNEVSDQLLQRILALKVEVAGRVRASDFEALNRNSASVAAQLVHLESEIREGIQTHEEHFDRLESSLKSRSSEARNLDAFYAAFEDRFRGDRSVVRARVEPYLALVREAGAGTRDAPVVDVGCGRGEWLELLRDSALIGRGIDINHLFIEACRGRGLEVFEGDAIESLQAVPDDTVGAVTLIHVIEHLPFESAIALLDEARRILRPGGLLIVETPNPENLFVAHHLFYMDPTHRNPLPPEALRWIVEARGFHAVRIERLVLARELTVPSPLSNDVPGAGIINSVLASLSAPQDYAIVAKCP
jgi:O-antigen chain-terminating methyltransferase